MTGTDVRGDVVLCVGEALVALAPPKGGTLEDAKFLEVSSAGAEVNVAVHLARLDVRARFAGVVGRDPLGRRLVSTLADEGVDTQYVEFDDILPTGLYLKNPSDSGTAVHYYRNGSAATRLRALPQEAMKEVGHVHLTGITPAISGACRHLVESLLAADGYTTSFDVNYRPGLWDVDQAAPVLRELAGRATVAFVGLDEARTLWDVTTTEDARALLPGTELVVKNSEHAAYAFRGTERAAAPPLRLPVLEPVGAGDAFAAGYLSARLRGFDLPAALRLGHAVAASALASRGDQGDRPDPQLIAMAHSGHGWPPA
ncbi:MAG TPA: sugar kinase [Nocardioidaceae bacterium]|nr:sugar kinase [Nocardioidaceae bacterium]